MAKKKESNPFNYGRKFKNEGPAPGEFPIKDPQVLKGIKDSVKGMEKSQHDRARFIGWGHGVDIGGKDD